MITRRQYQAYREWAQYNTTRPVTLNWGWSWLKTQRDHPWHLEICHASIH